MSHIIERNDTNLVRNETVQQPTERCFSPVIDELITRTSTIFNQIVSEINNIVATIRNDPTKYAKLFCGTLIVATIYHTIFALAILRITSR